MVDGVGRLEGFHIALVASIERTDPRRLREPFTIGAIYEDLIPYRTHRDLIGVAMNGDYEDGLMRLLAGEGGYLLVEPPEIAEVLAEELQRKPPDRGRYKQFRDAVVRLNPEKLDRDPPKTPSGSVSKLFSGAAAPPAAPSTAAPPQRPTRNGWDLDVRARADADEMKPPARKRAAPTGPPAPRDRVQTADQFWAERESREEEADEAPAPAPTGTPAETARLEAENRRLKILLAERVLEVEELRERLGRDAGASREKP